MTTSQEVHFRHDRRDGDEDLIVALHRLGYVGLGSRFEGECLEQFLDYVRQTLEQADLDNPSSRVWFVERDGQTVGCCALLTIAPGKGQLRWVVVTPEARGLGIGKTLMDEVFFFAREQRMTSITLYTIDNLEPSKTLYENLGFETTQTYAADLWYPNGVEVVMERATN